MGNDTQTCCVIGFFTDDEHELSTCGENDDRWRFVRRSDTENKGAWKSKVAIARPSAKDC